MSKQCCTETCSKLRPSEQRKVVWTIDRQLYCNSCYCDWMDTNEIRQHKIIRLFDNDALYEDTRRIKRRGPRPKSPMMTPGKS